MQKHHSASREFNSNTPWRAERRKADNRRSDTEVELTVIELKHDKEEADEERNGQRTSHGSTEETRRLDPNSMKQLQLTRDNALGWRRQLRGSWKLRNPSFPNQRRNGSRSSHDSNNNNNNNNNNIKINSDSDSLGPPKVTHTVRYQQQSSSPVKPTLERPDEMLEIYRSLQERSFATLHEELQYLRMTYVHSQRTLRLKCEEVMRLQKEMGEKSSEIDRLKALLVVIRKKRFFVSGPNTENEDNMGDNSTAGGGGMTINDSGRTEVTPSLALFAATAPGASNANNNATGRGSPAKMLLELRQNIASRDTVIDTLRTEIASLRKARKETDDQIRTTAAALEEAQTRCETLTADLSVRDARIEELGHQCSACTAAPTTAVDSMDNSNPHNGNKEDKNKRSNTGDSGYPQQQFEEYQRRYRATDVATGSIEQQLHRLEGNVLSPPSNNNGSKFREEQQEYIRNEFMQLRRCLEREKETTSAFECQWRRQRETDLRMTEVELDTAKAEIEAYKREVARMQRQLTTASFAEAQLQAARNENEALQQRVLELREENTAQASRERELRNNMRLMKEAYERREEEVASLQRRLKVSKESEYALREEIEALEVKLTHFEERARVVERTALPPLMQPHKGGLGPSVHAPPPHDLSSYASLMALNANLQDRVMALEVELQEAKETLSREAATKTSPAAAALMIPREEASQEDTAHTGEEAEVVCQINKLAREGKACRSELQHAGASLGPSHEPLAASMAPGKTIPQGQTTVKEMDAEPMSITSRRRNNIEIIRDHLQQQRHQPTQKEDEDNGTMRMKGDVRQSPERNTEVDALRGEVNRLRKLISNYDEELMRMRHELMTSNADVNTMRQQDLLLRETTQELLKKCEEQERIITSLRESTAMTASSSLNGGKWGTGSAVGSECDEEHIIEEALRQETARLDDEMNALRREMRVAIQERDHWKALATATTQNDYQDP